MFRFVWFTLVLGVTSVGGFASAADHDVIRLKKGTMLEGHCVWVQKGGLKIKLLDGEEVTVDIRTVEMIVFADPPVVRTRKLDVQPTPKPLVSEALAGEPLMPEPVNGLRGVYVAHGREAIDKNSRPFELSKHTVVFVAMFPHGRFPSAAIGVEGLSGTSGFHHLSTLDLDANEPVFMCKTFYDTFPGNFFADVAAKDSNWLLAVATSETIPSEADIDAFGATLMEFAAYPPTPLKK